MDWYSQEPMKYYAPPSSMSRKDFCERIEKMKRSGDYIYSRKYDGNYSRAIINGERGSVLQTRGISKKTGTYGEIQDRVLFWDSVTSAFNGFTVLLGEVFLPNGVDKDVGSILRCLPTKALSRQKDKQLQWRIFDVLAYEGEELLDKPMIERVPYIKKAVAAINNPLVIGISYYEMDEKFDDALAAIFEDGGEGVVATRKDMIYQFGKRGPKAWDSVKIKRTVAEDIDCFITGIVPATRPYTGDNIQNWMYWENLSTGKLEYGDLYNAYILGDRIYEPVTKNYFHNWPGAMSVSVYDKNGEIYHLCDVAGLDEAFKTELRDNYLAYHMMPVKISGMGVSTTEIKGVLTISVRHPRLVSLRNEDIDIKDCSLSKILAEN